MAIEKKKTMTQEGYDELVRELRWREGEERERIKNDIVVARGFGDLSENAEYDAAKDERRDIEARIEELEARPEPCIQVDPAELDSLRQQLQAEQQKTRELAALLQQQPQSRFCAGESLDQLWSLCGKMERTLGQMERMLDGPYRMTCYPEPPVDRVQAEPVMPAEEPVPVAESAPVTQAPSVKSLLQRIRKH